MWGLDHGGTACRSCRTHGFVLSLPAAVALVCRWVSCSAFACSTRPMATSGPTTTSSRSSSSTSRSSSWISLALSRISSFPLLPSLLGLLFLSLGLLERLLERLADLEPPLRADLERDRLLRERALDSFLGLRLRDRDLGG